MPLWSVLHYVKLNLQTRGHRDMLAALLIVMHAALLAAGVGAGVSCLLI